MGVDTGGFNGSMVASEDAIGGGMRFVMVVGNAPSEISLNESEEQGSDVRSKYAAEVYYMHKIGLKVGVSG